MIPNQHLDTSDILRIHETHLIIYGVPRSASSFTWQVMGDIFKTGVFRTHKYVVVPDHVPVIATIRDWRDALVSYWRLHYPQHSTMPEEGIWQYVAKYQEHICTLRYWAKTRPDMPVLRYEDTVVQPERLFEVAEQVGGPQLDLQERAECLAAHSSTTNRAIANNLKTFDKTRLMAPRHVHEAEVGVWRHFVDDRGASLITELLMAALEEWGYPL